MMEAFNQEEQRLSDFENQRIAWQTALLMNSTGNYKRRIQPTDLYKPIDSTVEEPVQRFESQDEKEEYLKNLMDKFGK